MKDSIIINNIPSYLRIDNSGFEKVGTIVQKQIQFDNPDEEGIEFYKEEDYFYRAPRFKTGIEEAIIQIDPPPGKTEEDKTPAILTIGPMLTMGMMSMSMGLTSLMGVLNGTTDLKAAAPSLIMTGAMLSTMMLWPNLQKKYQNKQRRKQEEERKTKYLKTK